jgi:hypothetical protein
MRRFTSVVVLLMCAVATWAEPVVYVVGQESADDGSLEACYWKNGEKSVRPGAKTFSGATTIAVYGNDVYVSGTEKTPGERWGVCYWKNGEIIPLPGGSVKAIIVVEAK